MADESSSDDQVIGEAVRTARGERTQVDVADRMTGRGWKWRHTTVVGVEKGDRSLKLAEARDLADVLGVPIARLLERPETAEHRAELRVAERDVRLAFTSAVRAGEELIERLEVLNAVKNAAKRARVADLSAAVGSAEGLLEECTLERAAQAARGDR